MPARGLLGGGLAAQTLALAEDPWGPREGGRSPAAEGTASPPSAVSIGSPVLRTSPAEPLAGEGRGLRSFLKLSRARVSSSDCLGSDLFPPRGGPTRGRPRSVPSCLSLVLTSARGLSGHRPHFTVKEHA